MSDSTPQDQYYASDYMLNETKIELRKVRHEYGIALSLLSKIGRTRWYRLGRALGLCPSLNLKDTT